MKISYNSKHKRCILTNQSGSLTLGLEFSRRCAVDQLRIKGNEIRLDSACTALETAGQRYSSLSCLKDPDVSFGENTIAISGIEFGSDGMLMNQRWKFREDADRIVWEIERTAHGDAVADEVPLPIWKFRSITDFTSAILGTGGAAWFKLFDSSGATYGVHTSDVLLWNADTGTYLRIEGKVPNNLHTAVRFTRNAANGLECSFSVAESEIVFKHDEQFHRRRFLPDRHDVWAPQILSSGTVTVEYFIEAFDYDSKYDRGTLLHLDKEVIVKMMNTIARVGVIDRYLHGSNSWRTPFGPVCLHEQFIAHIGLALDNSDGYFDAYKKTLDYYRDHAIQADGRVKARWAYTNEDAMPETSDADGFYEAQWGMLLDSNCDYVTNVAELFDLTRDFDWVRGQKSACEAALEYLLKRDTDGDGLVEVMTDSHTQKQGSDWIDVIWASHRNAFVNAKLYYALTLWSDVEDLLGEKHRARRYRDFAAILKKKFNMSTAEGGFWEPANRWYVYWLDKDNSVHGNNLVVPVNFMAIAYGICDDENRISSILDRIETEMAKEGLFAWPLCMFSFAPGEGMDFQYPFPAYENGDIFLAWEEVGVKAYARYKPEIAIAYVRRLLAKAKTDGLGYQRYSRKTQTGLGDDILANNCMGIVGLYRNIYGIQPKYNRLFLDPHITDELEGTIIRYSNKGRLYTIGLNRNMVRISSERLTVSAASPFGINVSAGEVEVFPGFSNRPTIVIQTNGEIEIDFARLEPSKGEGIEWSEKRPHPRQAVTYRILNLPPAGSAEVFRNGNLYALLKANELGEVQFGVKDSSDGPQRYRIVTRTDQNLD